MLTYCLFCQSLLLLLLIKRETIIRSLQEPRDDVKLEDSLISCWKESWVQVNLAYVSITRMLDWFLSEFFHSNCWKEAKSYFNSPYLAFSQSAVLYTRKLVFDGLFVFVWVWDCLFARQTSVPGVGLSLLLSLSVMSCILDEKVSWYKESSIDL